MNSRNFALRRYCRRIRSYLPCSGKLRKQILTEIQANVNDYLAEYPEAEFSQIEARFGTAQSIAAAYVDDMDTKELLSALRIRRKIITTISVCLLIALIAWASAVSYVAVKAAKNYPGIITVVTWEIDSTLPPSE